MIQHLTRRTTLHHVHTTWYKPTTKSPVIKCLIQSFIVSNHVRQLSTFNPYDPQYHSTPSSHTSSLSSSSSSSSSAHEENTDSHESVAELRARVLDLALAKVEVLGWTEAALRDAIAECQLSSGAIGLSPDGAFELVHRQHIVSTKRSLEAFAVKQAQTSMNTRESLFEALSLQLKEQAKNSVTLPQMIGLSLLPAHLPSTLSQLAEYCDDVWYLCGDESTDPTWYTKGASLGAIYTSSVLYLSTDKSEGFRDILGRRLDEFTATQRLQAQCVDTVDQYASMLARAVGLK